MPAPSPQRLTRSRHSVSRDRRGVGIKFTTATIIGKIAGRLQPPGGEAVTLTRSGEVDVKPSNDGREPPMPVALGRLRYYGA
jgi:hypothetical protein